MVSNGVIQGDWTTDDLLSFLKDNGFTTGKPDIFDIAKKSALSSVLTIDGDNVKFKGAGGNTTSTDTDPSQSQKVVQQMAKQAMK